MRCVWAASRWLFTRYARVVDVRISGEQIDGATPTLYVSNHLSSLDSLVLAFCILPACTHFLAKPALFTFPTGWWMRAMGAWNANRLASQKLAIDALKARRSVAIFPEGHRGPGPLQAANDGAAAIACLSGASIVPIAITGTEHALPRGSLRPRRSTVEVKVGARFAPPCKLKGRGEARWVPASQMIMSRLAALLPPEYQPRDAERVLGSWARQPQIEAPR